MDKVLQDIEKLKDANGEMRYKWELHSNDSITQSSTYNHFIVLT